MCSIPAAIGGALSAFQGLAMQGAAKDKANQVAQQEVEGTQSAEDNKRNKQLALSEGKEEKKVAASAGISLFQGLAMRSAAIDAAEQAYQVEVEGVANAETDKRNSSRISRY